VTLGTALERFRAATAARPSSVGVAAPAVAPTVTQPLAATTSSSALGRATAIAVAVPIAPTTTAATRPFAIPAEGVYTYKTAGGEQINILDASHSYPATTYATVRHQAGCQWSIENDVVQEHTDRRQLCSVAGGFLQIQQSRVITFFGKTDGGTYTCTPQLEMIAAGEPAGTVHDGVCGAADGAAHLHAVDMGPEQITVGGTTVTVVHIVVDGTLSGRAVGTSHDDLLLLATNGLTVQWIRSVDTIANAAFGAKAHYTEHASFLLTSLVPQT
jgi:hypothetical protein